MNTPRTKTLILMVGLPRSGKSTRAMRFGCPVVSPDAIRLSLHNHHYISEAEGMVWTMARYMVQSLFEAGHDTVVLDCCNTRRRRRNQWQSDKWTCKYCVINAPAHECINRASTVKDAGLSKDLIGAIDRMAAEYEPIEEDEGEVIA